MEQQEQECKPVMNIADQVALITGGAQGLGRAFAEALMARGAKVCLADVNQEAGQTAAEELAALHGEGNVVFVPCDVTKEDQLKGAWDECVEKLGSVSILINNAGIGNEQNWQRTLDVNVGGYIRGTMLALELMSANTGGSGGAIVNVSSIAGVKVVPLGPIYSTTKHAIVGLTRALGHEFHRATTKVTVQCLCPSLADTALLAKSAATAFSPQAAKAMQAMGGKVELLEPEAVATSLLQLLEEGRNGAVMVVEVNKEPYYVDSPVQ